MTDKEIIRALECHDDLSFNRNACKRCPILNHIDCGSKLAGNALDLINRQQAEIADEKAKKVICADVIRHQKEEIERLISNIEAMAQSMPTMAKADRAEAVKEFAERLKKEISKEIYTYWNDIGGGYYLAEDVLPDIDNLVKEMVGDK
jgi:sugar-specific transcriptional regulator TrmB